MNKLTPQVSTHVARIGLAAAEASLRYARQFADLRALAKVLQTAAELDRKAIPDHCKVAAVMVRLSDEYESFARADADIFEMATRPARKEVAALKPTKRASVSKKVKSGKASAARTTTPH
jgi:hypothetical protein